MNPLTADANTKRKSRFLCMTMLRTLAEVSVPFPRVSLHLANLWVYDSHFSLCLGVSGLVLQLAAIDSPKWVVIELLFAPLCWYKSPVHLRWECWGISPVSQDAGHAGLWSVCYSFPLGAMPKFYFYTAPYCCNFSDDQIPAVWLTTVQALCKLAIWHNVSGILLSSLAIYFRNDALRWTGSALLQTGGMSGVVGTGLYYINMSTTFLLPYNRDNMAVYTDWAFHSFLDGSVLTSLAGLLHGPGRPPLFGLVNL